MMREHEEFEVKTDRAGECPVPFWSETVRQVERAFSWLAFTCSARTATFQHTAALSAVCECALYVLPDR